MTAATPDVGEWAAGVGLVSDLFGSVADAERAVGRAFGWGSQKFWRGRVKQRPVSLETVRESLNFLRSFGLTDTQVSAVLKSFPEVLAVSTKRMADNVRHIQLTYPALKDARLVNAVLDNPAVLGYDFDCEGDCKSECARCWVQF